MGKIVLILWEFNGKHLLNNQGLIANLYSLYGYLCDLWDWAMTQGAWYLYACAGSSESFLSVLPACLPWPTVLSCYFNLNCASTYRFHVLHDWTLKLIFKFCCSQTIPFWLKPIYVSVKRKISHRYLRCFQYQELLLVFCCATIIGELSFYWFPYSYLC